MSLPTAQELKEEASRLRLELDATVSKYLYATGWNYTCNTPGAYWYWHKRMPDGRDLYTNRDGAVQMQEYLDGQ